MLYVLLAWFALTVWASFDVRSNYYIRTVVSNKKIKEDYLALTFDDGPTEYTLEVLDLLKKYHQKATFFCIGTCIKKHPMILQRIIEDGHVAANHTYSHSTKMGFLSADAVFQEVASNQKIIQTYTGKEPRLFRPPFGVTNPNIAKACIRNGVEVIGWNIRSLDTVLASDYRILQRMIPRLRKGSIILLHDTSSKTVRVVEQLLITMKQKGLQSVTVDELIQIKAYK